MTTYKILLNGVCAGFVRACDRDSAMRKVRKNNPQWFPEPGVVLLEVPS